jgi:nuclear pore complex protein Nup62
MDEIITRWASDLSKYQKEFKEQASKVAEWDRALVDNGEKIQKLYVSAYEAQRASNEIERQLSAVESQQDELEAWLNRYESEVDEMFARQVGQQGEQLAGPDQERERTYRLAESLTDRLDDMGKDLTKMIKEINDMSGTINKGSKPDDPVRLVISQYLLDGIPDPLTKFQLSQIVRVLNGHLASLQWIDTNAAALQAKISAVQKSANHSTSHFGASENSPAESFYRSYTNRR